MANDVHLLATVDPDFERVEELQVIPIAKCEFRG